MIQTVNMGMINWKEGKIYHNTLLKHIGDYLYFEDFASIYQEIKTYALGKIKVARIIKNQRRV